MTTPPLTHIAGYSVLGSDGSLRQRCAYCGVILLDQSTHAASIPVEQIPFDPGAFITVTGGQLVRVPAIQPTDMVCWAPRKDPATETPAERAARVALWVEAAFGADAARDDVAVLLAGFIDHVRQPKIQAGRRETGQMLLRGQRARTQMRIEFCERVDERAPSGLIVLGGG